MAYNNGPRIVNNGLVTLVDAGNPNSYKPRSSLINSSNWTLGSGGVTGYSQNGLTVENERVLGVNPFGYTSGVWETRASGDGNADGGWNTDYYAIDNTKLYRFSVWVKRTSSTSGGTFYLGLYGSPSAVIRTDTNTEEGNPYWECAGTSKYTQNVWYLVVGHCYPYTQSGAIRHPNTGIYTIAGGTTKVDSVNGCNIGNDVKWASTTTSALHRTYHFYCADSTTRLQLFGPRIDLVDGTEPSIADLLSGSPYILRDLSNSNNSASPLKTVTYNTSNSGNITFNGTNDYLRLPNNMHVHSDSNSFSYNIWFKSSQTTGGTLFGQQIGDSPESPGGGWVPVLYLRSDGLIRAEPFWSTSVSNFILSSSALNNNVWHNISVTYAAATGSGVHKLYVNGQLNSQQSGLSQSSYGSPYTYFLGAGNAAGRSLGTNYFSGNIGSFSFYSRELSSSEVLQNYNATKGRYI